MLETKADIALADTLAPLLPPFAVPDLDYYSDRPEDYGALARVLYHLAGYCLDRRKMLQFARADPEAAEYYRLSAERTYAKLPEWARW